MLNALRPLLLLAAFAVVLPVPAQAQRGGQREDASDRVRQVERDGGRVLQAQPMQRGGQEVYRYKVLTPEGRVRVLQGTPRQRPMPLTSDDLRTRRSDGPRPISGAGMMREREERALERRAAREAAQREPRDE